MLTCPRCSIRFEPDAKGNVLDAECFQELMDEGDWSGDYTDMLSDYRNVSGLYERERDEEQWGRLSDSPLMQEIIIQCMALYDSGTLKKIGNRIEHEIFLERK